MATLKRWGIPKPDREWLAKKFWLPPKGEGLTAQQIGEICSVSKKTVLKWLHAYGIEMESHGARRSKGRKSRITPPSKSTLLQLYQLPPDGQGKTLQQLADHFGVSVETVRKWLRKYKMTQPFPERHAERMAGKNNPAYSNGNSQPYTRRKLAKVEPILRCAWCKTDQDVQIHHIDHNRENNDLSNLMWLCRNCNIMEAHIYALTTSGRATATWVDDDGQVSIEIKFNKRS
jgi:transposase